MQIPEHKFYNCAAILEDGSAHFLDANWLHNNNIDSWKDWNCSAGSDRIFIASDGTVYSGECCNDVLGNINTEWQIFNHPTKCRREQCTGCTDDLMVTKEM